MRCEVALGCGDRNGEIWCDVNGLVNPVGKPARRPMKPREVGSERGLPVAEYVTPGRKVGRSTAPPPCQSDQSRVVQTLYICLAVRVVHVLFRQCTYIFSGAVMSRAQAASQ